MDIFLWDLPIPKMSWAMMLFAVWSSMTPPMKTMRLFQEAGINIICLFAKLALFYNGWY